MKYYLAIVFLFFTVLSSLGQNKIVDVQCGDKIESSFTNNHEWQSFNIKLDGGDNLKIYAYSKYGDFLKFNIDIYSPSGNAIIPSNDSYKNIHQIETGQVSGSGTYSIAPYNYQLYQGGGFQGELGDYVIEFICEKSNGEIISINTVNTKGGEIISEKTQFLSIPLDTPMKGEIKSGANQSFGFKTEIEKDSKAMLDFTITKGSVPIEIQIFDPSNKAVIFSSSFGYASSMQTVVNFPESREYIILIKESISSKKNKETTKFKVQLKKQ